MERDWAAGKRPRLGNHVRAARTFYEQTLPDRPFAFQVFVAGPRTMKFTVDLEEAQDLKRTLQELNAAGKPTWGIAHGTYQDVPWPKQDKSGKYEYRANFKWVLKWIRIELRRTASAGLAGLVLHLHTTPPEEVLRVLPFLLPSVPPDQGMPADVSFVHDVTTADESAVTGGSEEESAHEITQLSKWNCHFRNEGSVRDGTPQPNCVRLYLETPAVLPKNSHYESPQKLARLFRGIREQVDPFLLYYGLCIDTAHIWASGVDISSLEKASAWLAELEKVHSIIPPHAIVFHLNDNKHPLGSGKDHHAPVFHGEVWGQYIDNREKSGLVAFLDYARRYNVPTILERKGWEPAEAPRDIFPGEAAAQQFDPLTTKQALNADLENLARLGC